jgi:hypothetical protein
MLDNRAKPRSSPRGCGAANALLTALRALRHLGRRPGRRNGHSQPNKETDLKENRTLASPAGFVD